MFSAPCSTLRHQWGIVQPAKALSWSVELQSKPGSLAFSKQVNTYLIQKGNTKYKNHQKNIILILEGSRNDWFVHPCYRTYEYVYHIIAYRIMRILCVVCAHGSKVLRAELTLAASAATRKRKPWDETNDFREASRVDGNS